jgi:aldose 1-epimerase
MTISPFGEVDGTPVQEILIRSPAGARANVITWGAVLRDLVVPLAGGGQQRVVVGLETLEHYLAHSSYFGAIAGRYANRIGFGRFSLDGKEYQADRNQAGKHTLHGGSGSFGKRPWQLAGCDESSATLVLRSPDGDMGFPGALTVTCVYRLVEKATLRVELTATTDATTIVNLAHHSYFNLDGSPDILEHEMQVNASFITPVDEDLIPTGEIRAVQGTAFDFRKSRPIRRSENGQQARYDHNFVLDGPRPTPGALRSAVLARSPLNGLTMEVRTTEPGVQFYDGGKLDVPVPGLDGARYGAFAGFALEPQVFPDSPNKAHFPDPTLRPGEVYRQVTEYAFT